MTPESFFALARRYFAKHPKERLGHGYLSLHIMKVTDEGGGYRADTNGGCAWGDTVAEAIDAAYDHLRRVPSLRARLNPPHDGHEIDDKHWGARCISYDYRKQDWVPPDPKAQAKYGRLNWSRSPGSKRW